MSESVFADEWRECLRAHYMHVIRTHDRVTLPSLTYVMYQAGFTEGELAELRVRATLRADQMPADFVPDMNALKRDEVGAPSETAAEPFMVGQANPHPSTPSPLHGDGEADRVRETDSPTAADAPLIPAEAINAEADSMPTAEAEMPAPDETAAADEPDDAPDTPRQLTLF
jgi:hypothetical protein